MMARQLGLFVMNGTAELSALGLLAALVAWGCWTVADHHGAAPHSVSTPIPKATAIASQSICSPGEIPAFLDAPENADGAADFLQRCLQYPDLPGSHASDPGQGSQGTCELRIRSGAIGLEPGAQR